ncbi:hypothetical protein GALLR39Z86_41700 [Glycomyces algeriensis]|uniref:Uncharacterized protein n=1 Tax=Glycomyces algeriensis TaxID=256037 RepID=A0A9W6GCF0_9ACTN|nr:hypothetical protein GALLR39Z86_41700 [Glycomyces algeriensis]
MRIAPDSSTAHRYDMSAPQGIIETGAAAKPNKRRDRDRDRPGGAAGRRARPRLTKRNATREVRAAPAVTCGA